jgi:hypothetical protein
MDTPRDAGALAEAGISADASPVIRPPTGGSDVDASANVGCNAAVGASPRWSFDDSLDGWQHSGDDAVSLSWSETTGAAAAGSMVVRRDDAPVADAFVFIGTGLRSLAGLVVTVGVLVEADTDVSVKLFACVSGTLHRSYAESAVRVGR